ncbi:mother-specific HO expression [Diatrype stigma]|uniref:Mother-specific HO expression n=1 Tax=Diatrype stigma TaxID=117547 RepID=A0AAN9V3H9_9PEZI
MRSKANGASPEPKYNLSSQPAANGNAHIPSTIRTVPSFDVSSEPSSYDSPSARNSGFSSSIHSSASAASDVSHESQSEQSASTVRIKPQSPPRLGSPINISEDLTSPALSDAPSRMEETMADASLQVPNSAHEHDRFAREGSPQQWDGAVGKAGLGKTGRVINKLVSDNEALKRDIQIERIKAEEAKQAAKLIEDKMDRMVAEYESRLLEANVTKTLLSRKERQVESLQSAVELEKKRTADAQERERTWREEMEKSRRDANVQVEEANTQAALMEGRYNAIASHWKDQGGEVERAMQGLNAKIESLNVERKNDDDRINTLRDLCDQQDGNIRDLIRQKDEIARAFDDYKRQQDAMLKGIKESARGREEEQARTIEETKRVLGQLKWALNVKQNVKGAQ